MAYLDQEAHAALQRLAHETGSTVREVVALGQCSPILMRQFLDPEFAALAEEPSCDRGSIEAALDEEAKEIN